MLSSLKPVFVLALLAVGVMADSHQGRHARHHAIAARNPAAEAVAVPAEAAAPVKKRSRKTCRPRSATSSLVSSSAAISSSSAVSSSAITSSSEVTTSSEVKTTSTQEQTTSSETPTSTSTTHSHHTTHTDTPTPTPTPTPTATHTSTKPQPTTTSDDNNGGGGGGGNSFMAGTNTGDGTWYNTGLVACGQTYQDTDYIAAISWKAFQAYPGAGANPNLNPICGKKIRAHYQGKSVEVALVDECMGCDIAASIDFTPAAFSQLADLGAGRIHGITWEWI